MFARYLFSFIVLLIAFTGISYQFLISRVLFQFSQNESLNQSITLGFYLLAMGIGSAISEKFFKKNRQLALFSIEIAVSIVGLLLVPCIYFLHGFLNIFIVNHTSELFYGLKAVLAFQLLTVVVGLLTGLELPLLMKISLAQKTIALSNSKILALSYFGALLGSVVSASNYLLSFDFVGAGIFLGLLSLLAATFVAITNLQQIRYRFAILLIVPILLAFQLTTLMGPINQLFLKEYYANIKVPEVSLSNLKTMVKFFNTLDNIERYITRYQVIDMMPYTFMGQYDREKQFVLYLNNQVQFSSSSVELYHQTMVEGSFNITERVAENILILGGGDGLILAELKKIKGIKNITQVELDPEMVHLATYHSVLRKLNNNVYENDQVEIIFDDAFKFIRNTERKFDAVFIDFPFPTSYDLSKLYSLEFYSSLKKIINKNGFFIFDAPISLSREPLFQGKKPSPQDIILSTLHEAGFSNVYTYGLIESFYLVSTEERPLSIHYERLGKDLKNKTVVNLYALNETLSKAEISSQYVNSIFKPQNFSNR